MNRKIKKLIQAEKLLQTTLDTIAMLGFEVAASCFYNNLTIRDKGGTKKEYILHSVIKTDKE